MAASVRGPSDPTITLPSIGEAVLDHLPSDLDWPPPSPRLRPWRPLLTPSTSPEQQRRAAAQSGTAQPAAAAQSGTAQPAAAARSSTAQPAAAARGGTAQARAAGQSKTDRHSWRNPPGTEIERARYAAPRPSFPALLPPQAVAAPARPADRISPRHRHDRDEIDAAAMLIDLAWGYFRPADDAARAEWAAALDRFRPLVRDAMAAMAAERVPRWQHTGRDMVWTLDARGVAHGAVRDAEAPIAAAPVPAAPLAVPAAPEPVVPARAVAPRGSPELVVPSPSRLAPPAAHTAAAVPLDVLPAALPPPKAGPMPTDRANENGGTDVDANAVALLEEMATGTKRAAPEDVAAGQRRAVPEIIVVSDDGCAEPAHAARAAAKVKPATDAAPAELTASDGPPPPKRQKLKLRGPSPPKQRRRLILQGPAPPKEKRSRPQRVRLSKPKRPQRVVLSRPKPPPDAPPHDSDATVAASPTASDATVAAGTTPPPPPPPAENPAPTSRSGRNLRRPQRLGDEVERAGENRRGEKKRKRA